MSGAAGGILKPVKSVTKGAETLVRAVVSGPSVPSVPNAPPPPSKEEDTFATRVEAVRRVQSRSGRAANIVTGGLGLTDAAPVARKKLLGA